MAKINNQAVIQKLIDELKLYPAKDLIPTELADKILPVFQINDQNVNVTRKTATIVRSVARIIDGPTTLFTVPSTGKFFLTNVSLSGSLENGGSIDAFGHVSVEIDGVTNNILSINCVSRVFTTVGASTTSNAVALNLQNPVLLDPGSLIMLDNDEINDSFRLNANIVGYTEI